MWRRWRGIIIDLIGRGEVINGGFGLLLDGSEDAGERAKMMLSWDVLNGVRKPLLSMFLCYIYGYM